MSIVGLSHDILFEKILLAIENGVSPKEIRENPIRYIVSGETKKIVICINSCGLKVSYEIVNEMARRGCPYSKQLIEDGDKIKWNEIVDLYSDFVKISTINKDEINYLWVRLNPNIFRTNKFLIEIIEEGKINNVGGWILNVVTVYVEDWSYKICNYNDEYASEYIKKTFLEKV